MTTTENTDAEQSGRRTSPPSSTAGARQGRQFESGPAPTAKLKDLKPILRPHRTALLIAIFLSIIATVLGVAQPLVVQQMIDAVSDGLGVGDWVVLLVGVTLAEAVFRGLQSYALQRTGESVILGVRQSLIVRILNLPISEVEKRSKGDLMSRMGADSNLVRTVVTGGVFELVSAVLMFSGAVFLMLAIDPLLFLITFSAVVVGGVGVTLVGQKMRATSTRTQEQVAAMTTSVDQALTSLRLIKSVRGESEQAMKVGQSASRAYDGGVAMARLQAAVQPLMSISIQGAFVVVLAIGGIRVAADQMTIGDLMAFILYLFLLVMPVTQAMTAYTQIQSGLAAFDRISEILVLDGESSDDGVVQKLPVDSRRPHIEFDRVIFSYDHEKPLLGPLSFSVDEGSRVAIVGPTGAGKSTILSLLERFYRADEGGIFIRGVEIGDLEIGSYRRSVGYVEQNAPPFSGTLRENLLLGRSGEQVNDEQLLEALRDVGLEHLVERDGLGLDTKVGDGGSALSGGELQRLAWARVLSVRSDLLLFDEPTSSVDARTEKMLTELLTRRANSVTQIIVAHRLSTVISSDAIIVLNEGRISGIGTHSELMISNSLYSELARNQLLS